MRSEIETHLILLWTNDTIIRIYRGYVTNSSLWENLNGVSDLEDLDVDGKIILKLILRK
jgi:hypothetical protein